MPGRKRPGPTCAIWALEALLSKEVSNQVKRHPHSLVQEHPVSGSGWISHQPEHVPGVGHFFLGDVRRFSGQDLLSPLGLEPGELDLLAGGPPCQGFSRAGKRNVMDPRNSLVFEFARLVCEIRPRTIIMENVPGILDMVTPDGLPVVDAFCRILEDGGFGAYESFVQSIKAQAGSVGIVRGQSRKKIKEVPVAMPEPTGPVQLELIPAEILG